MAVAQLIPAEVSASALRREPAGHAPHSGHHTPLLPAFCIALACRSALGFGPFRRSTRPRTGCEKRRTLRADTDEPAAQGIEGLQRFAGSSRQGREWPGAGLHAIRNVVD